MLLIEKLTFEFSYIVLKLVVAKMATYVRILVKINLMFCFRIEMSVLLHDLEIMQTEKKIH